MSMEYPKTPFSALSCFAPVGAVAVGVPVSPSTSLDFFHTNFSKQCLLGAYFVHRGTIRFGPFTSREGVVGNNNSL